MGQARQLLTDSSRTALFFATLPEALPIAVEIVPLGDKHAGRPLSAALQVGGGRGIRTPKGLAARWISSRPHGVEQVQDQPIVSKNFAHVGSWIWWGLMGSNLNAVGQVLVQVVAV